MSTPYANLSPNQVGLLQVICYMAWSDGELSDEEKGLLLSKFSQLFANSQEERESLRQELAGYVSQNIPEALDTSVAQLQFEEDRELALKLGYMMMRASKHPSSESGITRSEKLAYRRLVQLLNLPPETIEKVEWAAEEELRQQDNANVIDVVSSGLKRFFDRLR